LIQYEDLIMDESINICQQLYSNDIKQGGHISYRGMSPTEDRIEFGTIKLLKSVADVIRIIVLLITALTINVLIHY